MWAGAEPNVRGTYDDEYFNVVHGIIQRLAVRGIYTLVDVHQDVMGRQVCGEGFPDVSILIYKCVATLHLRLTALFCNRVNPSFCAYPFLIRFALTLKLTLILK